VHRYELSQAPLRITGASSCFVATRRILSDYYATGQAPAGYEWRGAAMVHHSADVHADARIDGPCLIGPETRIAANAIVIGPTTIGRNVSICAGAVVCRSILWDDADVREHAFIDRVILTKAARAGANQSVVGRILHSHASVERN
jgi:NDP-sugar pyrophosphorylase family protein